MSRYFGTNISRSSQTMSFTNSLLQNHSSDFDGDLVGIYNKVELWSAFVLVVLSPITVITNGIFLFALYRDSLKCFRKTPTTAFVAGLSLADFITGLVVEPTFACYYIIQYYKPNSNAFHIARLLYIIGGTISTIAISTSFVTVLAMSLSQYIAIQCPHKYKTIVTTKRVIRLLVFSGLYFLAFSLLQFTGISRQQFLLWDVVLHPTLISFFLVIVHILMRRAFKQHVANPARYRKEIFRFKETSLGISRTPKAPNNNSFSTTLPDSPISTRSSSKNYQIQIDLHRCDKTRTIDTASTSSVQRDGGKIMPSEVTIRLQTTQDVKSLRTEVIAMTCGNHFEMRAIDRDESKTSFMSQDIEDMGTESSQMWKSRRRKRTPIEKQFAVMSLYLSAILLVSSVSHTIVFYIFLLKTPQNSKENVYIHIALRVTDLMLFIKVFMDAFIFAWRLPAFRTFLMLAISCGRIELLRHKV